MAVFSSTPRWSCFSKRLPDIGIRSTRVTAQTKLARLLRRFAKDEGGAFAVMFGVMAIVLIALGGAVVDYVTLEQGRNRAQLALDAAALALQPKVFEKNFNAADVQKLAEAFVIERIANKNIDAKILSTRGSATDGTLSFEANITVPTAFVALVGVPSLSAHVEAQAVRTSMAIEVAMVLDNSGSMGSNNRMTYLKQAATCATNIIFFKDVDTNCTPLAKATQQEDVRISIVPFTIMVNVGTQFKNAKWLDWTGQSPLSRLNFDNDDDETTLFVGPVNRNDLFTQTGVTWRGCVEARRGPYDTTDQEAVAGDTLFIPMFSPDTGDRKYNNYNSYNNYLSDVGGTCQPKTCTEQIIKNGCSTKNGITTCTGATTYKYTKVVGSNTTTPAASCKAADGPALSDTVTTSSGTTQTSTTVYSLLSANELQERLCKYNGARPTDAANSGPNAYCPSASILPLTAVSNDVIQRIKGMTANGGTNIQQGTIWGFHALSRAEPLSEAAPYKPGQVSKFMIVMTDGFNEPDFRAYSDTLNGTGIYGSWGFRKDGRLPDTDGIIGNQNEYNAHNSKADMTTTMDIKTVQTCANAKAAGIQVYTIGLQPPSQATRKMLTDCSSGTGYYFFPNTPAELVDVFKNIANQLSQLRLSR
jgi:Flp pilus assembly protein TadG